MSHQCPSCSNSFETIAGMKRHHALKHGESIAGSIQSCEWCGDDVRVTPSRTSLENTCSTECQNKLHSERMSGSDSPTWSGGFDEIECDMCGEIFEEYESQRRGENSFCSKQCWSEYKSTFVRGPDHPKWKDKPDYNYTDGWGDLSDSVRDRDGCCVICGMGVLEHVESAGRKPDVHHIVPSDVFEGSRGDFPNNLITMCRKCHRKVEENFWKVEPEVLLALAT